MLTEVPQMDTREGTDGIGISHIHTLCSICAVTGANTPIQTPGRCDRRGGLTGWGVRRGLRREDMGSKGRDPQGG